MCSSRAVFAKRKRASTAAVTTMARVSGCSSRDRRLFAVANARCALASVARWRSARVHARDEGRSEHAGRPTAAGKICANFRTTGPLREWSALLQNTAVVLLNVLVIVESRWTSDAAMIFSIFFGVCHWSILSDDIAAAAVSPRKSPEPLLQFPGSPLATWRGATPGRVSSSQQANIKRLDACVHAARPPAPGSLFCPPPILYPRLTRPLLS
jgi:hypothetical protein